MLELAPTLRRLLDQPREERERMTSPSTRVSLSFLLLNLGTLRMRGGDDLTARSSRA